MSNLCDSCIHRKVCICEDPDMPTIDCRYYDAEVQYCPQCGAKMKKVTSGDQDFE